MMGKIKNAKGTFLTVLLSDENLNVIFTFN
jgi:hypothetical protein